MASCERDAKKGRGKNCTGGSWQLAGYSIGNEGACKATVSNLPNRYASIARSWSSVALDICNHKTRTPSKVRQCLRVCARARVCVFHPGIPRFWSRLGYTHTSTSAVRTAHFPLLYGNIHGPPNTASLRQYTRATKYRGARQYRARLISVTMPWCAGVACYKYLCLASDFFQWLGSVFAVALKANLRQHTHHAPHTTHHTPQNTHHTTTDVLHDSVARLSCPSGTAQNNLGKEHLHHTSHQT